MRTHDTASLGVLGWLDDEPGVRYEFVRGAP